MFKQVGYFFVGVVAILCLLCLFAFICASLSWLVDGQGWKPCLFWGAVAVGVALVAYIVNRLGKGVFWVLNETGVIGGD